MIALWMMYATIVATILAAGAAVFERTASGGLHQRRWIWLLALVLSVALPVSTVFVPTLGRQIAAPNDDRVASAPVDGLRRVGKASSGLAELLARADTRPLQRLDSPLVIAWSSAAVLALIGYAVATWLLARRRRTWRRTELDGQPVLLAPATGPAVIGALHPQIVVPEWSLALSAEQRALMIEHERQHVRAKDPLVLHVAAMVALLMPWNVAAWWLNRRLRLAVELDCDARVLASGRDLREYGTLLLDVCARRSGSGLILAPALFERTSSLTTRILAMHPSRSRYPRIRITLGAAAALAITVLACEMPTPEMLAPDGKDVASKRLYGEMETKLKQAAEANAANARGVVTEYFPAIAQGEGGPSILYVVRSSAGKVVLTESQPATLARVPMMTEDTVSVRLRQSRLREAAESERVVGKVVVTKLRAEATVSELSNRTLRFKTRQPNVGVAIPQGVGALRGDDIATVDVTKHAAGSVAPNAVSIISIVLKPNAVVPNAVKTP